MFVKKVAASPPPAKTTSRVNRVETGEKTPPAQKKTELKPTPVPFAPAHAILTTRANPLIKQIETGAGNIKINLYDNGEIDGDTVSVYHNNELVVSKAKLSQNPISLSIKVDPEHPHHELIMVAHNLGSIPPNTTLMIVNVNEKRYEVLISSTEQKNAKVVLNLKE